MTEWNGYHFLSVSRTISHHKQADKLAWNDVAAVKDEERQAKDNAFRAHHPHLAEWKEVSLRPSGGSIS